MRRSRTVVRSIRYWIGILTRLHSESPNSKRCRHNYTIFAFYAITRSLRKTAAYCKACRRHVEQQKVIKYNQLAVIMVVLHNRSCLDTDIEKASDERHRPDGKNIARYDSVRQDHVGHLRYAAA